MAVLGLRFCARAFSSCGERGPLFIAGLSLSRPLLLRSTGSRRAGSVVVAHRPSCSAACGIFPDQGSNPCPLHWQADSQPLCHQGSPNKSLFCLYLWKIFFAGYRIESFWQFFSFDTLRCLPWDLLTRLVSDEKSAFIFAFLPLYLLYVFLWLLPRLSHCHWF